MIISLVGPNLFAKQRELHNLIGVDITHRIFGEDGLSQWYEKLGQSDLFGQSPTVIGERIFEDLNKRDQETLAQYLTDQGAASSEQKITFLVNDEKLLNKSQLGALLGAQKILQFPKPTPAKLNLWVQQESERLGVTINKALIPSLIEKLSANQFALQTELERWSLHQPAEITPSIVQSITPLETDTDTFGLTTAWEQKNPTKVMNALSELRLQGIADQMIVGMLGWKIESLLQGNNRRPQSGKWTQNQLRQAMLSLFKFDLAVKQGKADPEVGLELWLLESMGITTSTTPQ